jgi:hypothetical protein
MDAVPGLLASLIMVCLAVLFGGVALLRRSASWARVGGFAFLGLIASVSLLFAIGEMAGGVPGGEGHLIPVFVAGGLMLLARWRETLAGVVTVVIGSAAALFFGTAMQGEWLFRAQAALLTGVPLVASGSLLLIAGALKRPQSAAPGPAQHFPV